MIDEEPQYMVGVVLNAGVSMRQPSTVRNVGADGHSVG
jgi:hypothetical protein